MSKKSHKPRQEPETLGLPCVGVESHAHLDSEEFADDLEELLDRAEASGISHIVQVFLSHRAYLDGRHLFEGRNVSFLLGTHPNDADQLDDAELDAMREAFKADPRLVGVGEIGLDFYWDDMPRDLQECAFIRQLELARELEKPVVIHSRDSNPEAIAILEKHGFRDFPVLWHCFGADVETAERLLANGWHISIPGPITYRKTEETQAAVARIPLDRLLLETDCPYLAPEPWRGKRNHPALIAFTARRVAEIKGIAVEDLWRIAGENARRFFGIR